MLVATAGHIDHGKTSLIRALTGVETDRLPEERARGISIDLGFAYWAVEGGQTIGFVDVPGHERFIRNMLAGVGSVDFALLVVAADDGVMPQTVEHVQILDLLGVRRGVAVITKIDRTSRDRIDLVEADLRKLLAPTHLSGSDILRVSSVTGQGLQALKAALGDGARNEAPRHQQDRHFRLAIDRAFSVPGAGTVVTGTVRDGASHVGDRLVLSPRGREVRVRGFQSAGHAVETVAAGQRCAVNLAGADLDQIHRGDWLLAPELHAPTQRLEVIVRLLPTQTAPLKHHTPVHLHLGAADLTGRVLIPAQASIPAGGEASAQLTLDQPTHAVIGDRFVLRDQSGRRSIGGGVVIDPAVAGRRRTADRAPVIAALSLLDPSQALSALLEIPGYEIEITPFDRGFNLTPEAAKGLYEAAGAALLGGQPPVAVPSSRIAVAREEILARLEAFHRAHPGEGGMTPRALKSELSTPMSAAAFSAVQRQLANAGLIVATGPLVRLSSHTASLSPADQDLLRKLERLIDECGAVIFTADELTAELRTSEAVVKALLYRLRANGEVWRVTEKRFALKRRVAALAASAAKVEQEIGGKGFTAAQYRDAIGTGRTLAIQILEFFDDIGVTYRNGDLRRMRRDYQLLVGEQPPHAPTTGAA
jgi:selenocysteine-specific elongation factor